MGYKSCQHTPPSYFEESEARAELSHLKSKSAAGPDSIGNKMLRNLRLVFTELENYGQECWEQGQLPEIRNTAQIVMIPNQEKNCN